MNALRRIWDHFEEMFIAFLLAAMTLVTFVYVMLNNLYTMFYTFAEKMPSMAICRSVLTTLAWPRNAGFDSHNPMQDATSAKPMPSCRLTPRLPARR